MKCLILLTILSAQILASPQNNHRVVTVEKKSDVNKDIQEFINLLPSDKISLIFKDYIKNDIEVGQNWNYLHRQSVQEQLNKIGKSRQFQKVLDHLTHAGVNIPNFMIEFHLIFSRVPPATPVTRNGPGLEGLLLGSIKPLIPMSKIKMLATQKYVFSSEFRGLIKTLTSKVFKNDISDLVISNDVKLLENDAVKNGVNMEAIYEFVASFKFLYEYLMDL